MPNIAPIKGKPGEYKTATGTVKLVEWREDWRFDTVVVVGSAAGVLTQGQTWEFFRDLQGKDLIDANIPQPRRISRGEDFTVNGIGVHIGCRRAGAASLTLNEVFHFIAERMYLNLKINKDDIAEGPLMAFQSGLGVAGFSNDPTPDGNVLTNGVASLGAVRPLLVQQELTAEHDISATLTNFGAGWITAATPPAAAYVHSTVAAANGVFVKLLLNGYVKKAMGRN